LRTGDEASIINKLLTPIRPVDAFFALTFRFPIDAATSERIAKAALAGNPLCQTIGSMAARIDVKLSGAGLRPSLERA